MIRFSSNAEIAPCLTVVVPVFNEAATVGQVLEQVLAQRPVVEVIVVDDGSSDGTWSALQPHAAGDARVKLFRHEQNEGKGAVCARVSRRLRHLTS